MVFGYILALGLSVIDFITEGMFSKRSVHKPKFVSFSSGLSVSYLLIVLLPGIYISANEFSKLLFLPILFGFGVFHIVEKYISQHFTGGKARKEHNIFHSVVSFTNFFIVGYLLVRASERSMVEGVLLFIPVTFHIVIDSLPKQISKNKFKRALSTSSAFMGAIAAFYINVGDIGNIILFSIVGGSLLYIVIRESIPEHGKGKPMYFTMGLLLFTLLVLMLWNVGVQFA
ncbi:hypothetical protein HOD20_03280 [archaeon]|jgi:hypothetical protein|nr:hypothetical protein [archaeon]MBT4646647.1 hypothetical protein [archaeon]MBT6821904.1 hypothetical protein [archaeon]MBT7392313.1 hypothetical protein [archaeon]